MSPSPQASVSSGASRLQSMPVLALEGGLLVLDVSSLESQPLFCGAWTSVRGDVPSFDAARKLISSLGSSWAPVDSATTVSGSRLAWDLKSDAELSWFSCSSLASAHSVATITEQTYWKHAKICTDLNICTNWIESIPAEWGAVTGFCNMFTPGNTIMLMYFMSCLFDSSRGRKPNTFVHVSLSSDMAGITNFSTPREERIW